MASLLLTVGPAEEVSYSDAVMSGDGKLCPSPMSTFGSDFNDNLFLQASNADNFEGTNHTEVFSQTTNNLQRITEPEQVEVNNMKGQDDDVDIDDRTEDIEEEQEDNVDTDDRTKDIEEDMKTILSISVFATNVKKSDIECEKDKYYIKVKTKVNIQKHRKNRVKNAKKEKRKNISADFGFLNVSLFPRPSCVSVDDDESALEQYYATEQCLDDFEGLVAPYKKELLIEGRYSKHDKHLRSDRDRKIRKAHIQVKDKYCKSVRNNGGQKSLFVHHRVYNLMVLEVQRLSYMPSARQARLVIRLEEINARKHASAAVSRPAYNSPHFRPAPRGGIQNLAYAIDNNNAAQDLDSTLVNILITLQNRDLTPEDYETLLRLDENVAPKTLEKNVLESFRTDIVDESCVSDTCAICMDQYTLGQSRKFLPCNHVFHTNCIDMWLNNSSLNCPIDNLPVDVINS